MNRLVLGEIDSLTSRMEALAADLANREHACAESIRDAAAKLAKAAIDLPTRALATGEAAFAQRAKEQWTILGAVASRAASDAAGAAVAGASAPRPIVAQPRWLLPLLILMATTQVATAIVVLSMVAK